jgi:hypothetical protein
MAAFVLDIEDLRSMDAWMWVWYWGINVRDQCGQCVLNVGVEFWLSEEDG